MSARSTSIQCDLKYGKGVCEVGETSVTTETLRR